MSNRIEQFFDGMIPTGDQRRVAESLESFFSGDAGVFILNGYAGTGKTTLLRSVCKYLDSQSRTFRLLAPTGRATQVLRQTTGYPCQTIHRSIYNLAKVEEAQEGNTYRAHFSLQPNTDSSDCIYLVDEASLLSDVFSDHEFFVFGSGYLLRDLLMFSDTAATRRKIVFIGDDAQLPPVNMNFSPALSPAFLQKYISHVQTDKLEDVVRQEAGSGILTAATAIRQAIHTQAFHTFTLPSQAADISPVREEEVIDTYFQRIGNRGPEYGVLITHSNRQALDYNLRIRERLWPETSDQVRAHDWLLITRNNYHGQVELFNGMFARVLEVGGISYQVHRSFTIAGGKRVTRHLDFRDVRVEVMSADGTPVTFKTTLLDSFLTSAEGSLHPYDHRALYVDFKERMRHRGIKPGTREFWEQMRSDLYFNALQVKYGYALTCHKAQGGEWPEVLVDMKVYCGRLSAFFFRWVYTAFTRSGQHLHIVNAQVFSALSHFVVKDTVQLSKIPEQQFYTPAFPDGVSDFVGYRKWRISALCREAGIRETLREHAYQLVYTFERANERVEMRLWYGKGGFTRNEIIAGANLEWQEALEELLAASLQTTFVPPVPQQSFQAELQAYLIQQLEDTEIELTNIVNRPYSVVYFLQADDYASLEFFFNKKQVYTSVIPSAMKGKGDLRLQLLLEKISGNKF